jgi:acyl-coenzyme A thioesterase PaaI-like protein
VIDVDATGAAWSGANFGEAAPRAATISYTVDLLRPALASDLLASARVTRRGRMICHCEVDVTDSEGRHVAKGLVIYRIG